MNLIKSTLIIVIILLSFSSCKKCTTCTYTAPGYNNNLPKTENYCGTRKKDIDAFKKLVSDDANLKGTTATCTDK